MAFENLSNKLQEVFKQLRSKGKLTENDVKTAMREVKIALLEADVNFKIVKQFIKKVTERAVGTEVLEGLNPGQQVIKIVNDELIDLMGTTQSKLTFANRPPTIYMMVGLQGAGKTTSSGKLAGLLRKQGKNPLLVACDVYRPAAIKQLQVVGKTYNIPVFEMGVHPFYLVCIDIWRRHLHCRGQIEDNGPIRRRLSPGILYCCTNLQGII